MRPVFRTILGLSVKYEVLFRCDVYYQLVWVQVLSLTWCSSDVRLMKRRKSSPPEDTATEESSPVRQSVAHFRLSLRPRMVSPEEGGRHSLSKQDYGSPETWQLCSQPAQQTYTPLSLLRNSSRVRIAATAEAMSGSFLI